MAIEVLVREHAALVESVRTLPEGAFGSRHGRWTGEEIVAGVAAHDLYHAGQIQLVKRFFAEGGERAAPDELPDRIREIAHRLRLSAKNLFTSWICPAW